MLVAIVDRVANSLQRADHYVVTGLNGMDREMADGGGNDPAVQLRLRFGDQPDKVAEAEKRLFQKVMCVGQPQQLEAVGQRVAADEVAGCECRAAPGRKNLDSPARFRGRGLVPLVEFLERFRLMRRRALGDPVLALLDKVVFAVEIACLLRREHAGNP
jgi:hypothetical protein